MDEPIVELRPERAGLSRARIVRAGIELVDAHGLTALSMRRLGAELGVEAMALYRYINGREDLLEAMVDELTGQVHLTGDLDLGPDGGWQAYLQALAHDVRDIAHAHPNLFPLMATRHPAAPWLRPPLRSLDLVEDFLAYLTGAGFSDDDAVDAYKAFTSFLVGHLLLTVAQRTTGPDLTDETLDEGGADVPNTTVDLSDYPEVTRLRTKLSEDHAEEEFERTLEQLLDRIDASVSQ
ncbi:TetR/AcrR family transcriptional regulator [Georgenia sp. TF02-10]|uniref:TetR/AcrR family transcriptional regulator n=1 Tax=Georgenia sp. TF02-10 TaxID=2917725 RepID=UPI001FA7FDA1|nr:TetR/AcrR family transcriptional regulator [Georgenia sp. TF02-10]UNX54882.1 TetR/AcrR family transcriptional regulator [Georgenia sp. TF02-10]